MNRVGRLRPALRRRRGGVAGVGAVLVAGAAAIGAWPQAWPWLAPVTAAVAALVPVVTSAWAGSQQDRNEVGLVTREKLQGTTGRNGTGLPTVAEVGLDTLRVHHAVLIIPYIRRDKEDQVRRQLESGRPVLIVGASMVGKTRMAANVIKEMFATRRIIIPNDRGALAALDAVDIDLHDTVIWLDDIDRLIGVDGITDGSLRRLTAAGNAIVATIPAREYDRYQPTDQLRPLEWDVLRVFARVFIDRTLSHAEQERLSQAVDDPTTEDRIRHVGLGEYVGAAERINEALDLGPSVSPVGYALVQGAADWQRAGMTTPIPATLLPTVAAPHLDARGHTDLSNEQIYQDALAWATRDINFRVSLLQRSADDAFTVFDYALDLISTLSAPIPDPTWQLVIKEATTPQLISVGYAAMVSYQLPVIAAEAMRKAAESGHPEMAPLAAFALGFLLQQQGDTQGARSAYQQAIDSGHADVAPMAAFDLGRLRDREDDVAGACMALQWAIDSGHAEYAPRAMFSLGLMLQRQGDLEGARTAYQKAMDSGHAEQAPRAAFNLGLMLQLRGRMQGARAAYQQAIDSGHAEQAPKAAVNLGLLREQEGDTEGARAAYQQAIDSGHAAYAPMAAFALGHLYEQQGDITEARSAYQQAIDSGHDEVAPRAVSALEALNNN